MLSEKMYEEIQQIDEKILSYAIAYAKNLMLYGSDVTKEWNTATVQSANLEKAYRKGYYDAMRDMR